MFSKSKKYFQILRPVNRYSRLAEDYPRNSCDRIYDRYRTHAWSSISIIVLVHLYSATSCRNDWPPNSDDGLDSKLSIPNRNE